MKYPIPSQPSLARIALLTVALALSSCAESSPPNARRETSRPSTVASSPDAQRIDQEVARVLAGPHGALPAAQVIKSDPTAQSADITIENDTNYTLSAFFSGPTSRSVALAPHETERTTLGPGTYSVAARVDGPVVPFAGRAAFPGGEYDYVFYIE